MKKVSTKTATVDTERLVQALEGLIRDHRAGKGDVLNRMGEGQDEHSPGAVALRRILTLALFGEQAIPKQAFNGGTVVCNEREHAALSSIGSGSAEKGAAVIVAAAKAWAKADRAGIIAWASKAVPKLDIDTPSLKRIKARGLRAAKLWELPVADRTWFVLLQDITGEAMKGQFMMAGVIVCAMALEWNQPAFRGRAFGPRLRGLAGIQQSAGRALSLLEGVQRHHAKALRAA